MGRAVGDAGQPLQAQAEREQFLDDVVVQIAGDALVVLRPLPTLMRVSGDAQLQRDRGLRGEGGRHAQVRVGERRPVSDTAQCERPDDVLTGGQGHDEQRPGRNAHRDRGVLIAVVGNQRGLAGADGASAQRSLQGSDPRGQPGRGRPARPRPR